MVKINMKNTNNTKIGTYFYNDEFYNFEFSTTLSVSDKVSFVNSVVDTVVGDNYYSIVRNLMFDYIIIKVFTKVDTSFINNSADKIDVIEKFLEETNIVDIIKANMEDGLLEELNIAVDKAIEYRTGIHPSPIADALSSLFSALEKKVEEFDMGSMIGMAQKLVSMTDEFNLDNVVNAYMNSDTHKSNLVEIEKAKKNEIKIDENLGEAVRSIVKEAKAENNNKK